MSIDVLQLNGTEYAETWIRTVFNDQSCFDALPDENRNGFFVSDLIERARRNQVIALMPVVQGISAGLYWGSPWEAGIWSVHQFVMPAFRKGFIPVRIAKTCAKKAFSLSSSIEYLIGFTPVTYRAAVITANRAGFKTIGIFPKFHTYHGQHIDCAIVMKGRDNG